MAPSFYSSVCPVFSVAWLGNRSQEENESYVLYSGGGGSTKSGVKNQIVVGKLSESKNSGDAPTFDQVCAVETEDRICSTFDIDEPRENGKAQLVALGLGNMLMVYGVASTHDLVAVSAGAEFKGKKEGSLADVKSIAFDKKSGKIIASGDEDGVIRLVRLLDADKVLKCLAVLKSPTDELSKIKFDEKVVELNGHQEAVLSLQFSSSGVLLCSSSRDGTCRIWHVASGRELCIIEATANMPPAYAKDKRVLKQMCRVARFSNDEKSVYTLQSAARGNSHVTKWTLQQGEGKKKTVECTSPFTVQVANCPVTTLELSPCQQFLVTGDTKGVVSVFDANTMRKVKSYEGHQLPVSALCLSTGSFSILTGSGDKTIIIGLMERETNSSFFTSFLFLSILFLVIAWLLQKGGYEEHLPLFLNEVVKKMQNMLKM